MRFEYHCSSTFISSKFFIIDENAMAAGIQNKNPANPPKTRLCRQSTFLNISLYFEEIVERSCQFEELGQRENVGRGNKKKEATRQQGSK
jgi:hypothetical protein